MSTRHPPKPPPAADDFSDPVVNDFDQLQLVVAGPGAGKTALFKRVLSARPAESNLAITFINNLVKDLEKALEGLASVNTFHGYAKSLLHQLGVDGLTPAFDYCPRATEILCSETCWLLGTPVSHDQLIQPQRATTHPLASHDSPPGESGCHTRCHTVATPESQPGRSLGRFEFRFGSGVPVRLMLDVGVPADA
jgi:hypothetical protein